MRPYLFDLVMDELTRHIHDDIPCCLLFADDIILVYKTGRGNAKLEVREKYRIQEDLGSVGINRVWTVSLVVVKVLVSIKT